MAIDTIVNTTDNTSLVKEQFKIATEYYPGDYVIFLGTKVLGHSPVEEIANNMYNYFNKIYSANVVDIVNPSGGKPEEFSGECVPQESALTE